IVADKNSLLLISGNGDVLEPDEGIIAIGSGGNYALAAAKAFVENKKLSSSQIVERSLKIASDICIYTNNNIMIEEI
ncbi:MAG: HslU--HslV peptidase proteolytic subunit, partial [Candidatus Cloacimonadota bacterium]|nr:HslU--HslV peptidase proteolytic subunit [Candidatus Cloacimonadota bacterium]